MAVIAYQYRGELVDQIHRGHIAVTDHTGRILWKLGDPERLIREFYFMGKDCVK